MFDKIFPKGVSKLFVRKYMGDMGDGRPIGEGIHAKSGRLWRYISANFFGFSAKFKAENAKSILHPSHRLR